MTATPAASLGPAGEDLAAAYLEARGYRIVARNWRLASGEVRGELDLVARRDGTLVFVEVKTRRGEGFGGPLAAVTARKQLKLRALATAFLRHAPQHAARLRFDVIGVLAVPGSPPRITHVPDAF